MFGSKDGSRAMAASASAQSGVEPSLLKKMLPILAMVAAGYVMKQAGHGQGELGGALGGILGGQPSQGSPDQTGAAPSASGGISGGPDRRSWQISRPVATLNNPCRECTPWQGYSIQLRDCPGTTPPFSASLAITALCSAIFSSALPSAADMDVELIGELLARVQAGVQVEQLQKVDDRALVVAAAALHRRHFAEHRADIDVLRRGGLSRGETVAVLPSVGAGTGCVWMRARLWWKILFMMLPKMLIVFSPALRGHLPRKDNESRGGKAPSVQERVCAQLVEADARRETMKSKC